MLNSLKLLLPALLPSWRFFDVIAPSPRIEYALLDMQELRTEWQEFRPPPAQLSLLPTLQRLLWNPQWNETLFMMSCAERIMEKYTAHSENEILSRIVMDWQRSKLSPCSNASYAQFRLVLVQRDHTQLLADELTREICFISRMAPLLAT